MQDLKDIVYMQDIAEIKKEHAEEVKQLYDLFHITNMQRRDYKWKCKKLIVNMRNTEKLLQELLDRHIIKEWYYNGTYHWEFY